MPIGTSKTPGLRTSPLTPTNLTPGEPFLPAVFIQSTPFARITGTKKKVSTLLMTVGLAHSPPPTCPGNGGLLRGSARLPSIASSSALSSPQM